MLIETILKSEKITLLYDRNYKNIKYYNDCKFIMDLYVNYLNDKYVITSAIYDDKKTRTDKIKYAINNNCTLVIEENIRYVSVSTNFLVDVIDIRKIPKFIQISNKNVSNYILYGSDLIILRKENYFEITKNRYSNQYSKFTIDNLKQEIRKLKIKSLIL
jgi:hypothetical protein